MSKISKVAKKNRQIFLKKPVVNFMGGVSYELNPLETLKMISASSIFAEPQYYRNSGIKDAGYKCDKFVEKYAIFDINSGTTASELMIDSINNSLDYDFEKTIEWAIELRKNYYMRLNPQLIMVLASIHPKRKEFSEKNPGLFRKINFEVMNRADEPATQLALYLYNNGSKNKIPSILKRSWCDKLESLSRYEVSKYKNSEIGIIDTVRICHANSQLIDELLTNGTVEIDEEDKTWQNLRSEGKSFKEIVQTIRLPHMALLRNLKNIFKELEDSDKDLADKLLNDLKKGVKNGKQFPFRYYSAYNKIKNEKNIKFLPKLLDTLEECIDISIDNMPKLKGKTMCLSDNSGSAWGTLNSEYGTMRIASIDNLSSFITGACSEEGYVGEFGDRLNIVPVSKRNGILNQSENMSKNQGRNVGRATENGIWLFFQQAINNNDFYDNIFIYSDMQAGHGGLYGTGKDYLIDGESFKTSGHGNYIDVMKLIDKYRAKVNPKVNIFCVQTAGYNNVLIPEFTYRGAVLYGWTGKESLFASKLIEQWNEIENKEKR